MALGSYDNNRGEERKRPTVYSPYGFANTVSAVEVSRLSFSFWNKMLKITITPMVKKNDDGTITWDREGAGAGYLTHSKALILANEIRNFLSDRDKFNSSGIISNETLITISNGKEFGVDGTYLVLRKIDKETGKTVSSWCYQFNTDFYNSVRNYDETTAAFSTEFDEYTNLEINQMLTLLDSYVESMTYAQAYANIDSTDYNYSQILNVLNACAKGLGVETGKGGYSGGSSKNNSSVFNQRSTGVSAPSGARAGSGVQHVSAEDLEEDLFG